MAGAISLRERYTYRARRAVLLSFRDLVAHLERANAQKLSTQRLSQLIEDEFFEYSDTLEVDDPFFKSVWEECALDPKTLKSALTCELKLNLLDAHVRTFRVLEAFLQITAHNPPSYLEGYNVILPSEIEAREQSRNIENPPALAPAPNGVA